MLGRLARGLKSDIIDLPIISDEIDKTYFIKHAELAESSIGIKIRYLVLGTDGISMIPQPNLLIYESETGKSYSKPILD